MKFSNHTKAFIILTCLSPIAHGASPDEKTADLSRGISHSHGPTALQARIAANLLVERSVAAEVPATLAEVAAASREVAASARSIAAEARCHAAQRRDLLQNANDAVLRATQNSADDATMKDLENARALAYSLSEQAEGIAERTLNVAHIYTMQALEDHQAAEDEKA